MPTISNVDLTLTTVDANGNDQVTIKVDYDVEFTKFERQLVGLGLSYDTHVTIHDFDGGDTPGAQILDFYPNRKVLAVTVGNGSQKLHGSESRTVSRTSLQVDPAGDDVELKAFVRVHANGWLDEFTPGYEHGDQLYPDNAVSEQGVLAG